MSDDKNDHRKIDHRKGPVTPATVSVVGAPPKSWTAFWVCGGIGVAAFVAVAICAAAHAVAGVIFFGIFGVGWSGLVLLTLWGARSVIGRPQVTAGPDGIWAPAFQLPWDQIRALDFVSGGTSYGKIDPHQTHAARRRETSLVVTSRATNKNGRPLQYGTTLHHFNSENFDEFRSAVRALAPHVEFWTTLNVSDYVVDPTAQQELTRQLAATGRVAVTTRRGKEKMYFDRNGVGADGKFVPWTSVTGVIAVIDLHTTSGSTGMGKSTSRTPKLVIVTNMVDQKGNELRLRPTYEASYQPPVEHLLPLLRQLAPHVQIADQRAVK
ncbi:hypothetical protein EF294_09815 [Gordonia oryzae]|uniref:Uncharacterized protein n=1 Tax=Gordonia oryzae TaxID=2487349 RepID=A0A3N4GHG0_9ACTN|nr:hypothetical protein [Gordonia oryzae]RPA62289.1 hypothetical protein EF294_09815 [Gordonia oryzae]